MKPQDLDRLMDIDGTVESTRYLHLDRAGEGAGVAWRLEERPLRQKLIDPNALTDDARFTLKQLVLGAEEGVALSVEDEGNVMGIMGAVVNSCNRTLRLVDLRIDFDHRRQGLGSALIYRSIQEARDRELRAVVAQTLTNNLPGAEFLRKTGFELAGLDARLHSNHDLVKDAVALFWYAALD